MLWVKNGNQPVSILFQTLPYWTCLGIKTKTELYVTSVTDVSFHFSERGCHAVTHHLKTFLPLTGKSYIPSLPLPSSLPRNQNLTYMSSNFLDTFPVFFCPQKWTARPTPCITATVSHSQLSPALTMVQPNKDNNIQGTQKPMFLISHFFYFIKVQLRHGVIPGEFTASLFWIEFASNGA